LRLVGASTRQVRRIAAAESLAGAATGLVLGALVFLVFRQVVPHVEVLGASAFSSDVIPAWPLVVLIVLLVPVLAIGTALFALRGTVIEPLGVVRGGRPVRRRLWWRAALIVLGVALMFLAREQQESSPWWSDLVVVGASALLIGVPVLLPWLLERSVSSIRGGAVSWQLAVRRLQLDSGTPARVVGGVAVVLAGAIALQTVVAAAAARLELPQPVRTTPGQYVVHVDGSPTAVAAVNTTLAHSKVVHASYPTSEMVVTTDATGDGSNIFEVQIASCDAIRLLATITDCRDGDVFGQGEAEVRPGTKLTPVDFSGSGKLNTYGQWTVPAVKPLTGLRYGEGVLVSVGSMLITPGALAGVRLPPNLPDATVVHIDPSLADGVEYVRNAVAAYPLQTWIDNFDDQATLSINQRTFLAIRNGLLIGSLFTLLLAGVSLLVLALEQVRERRRSLAMQAASGVSRAVLARSLLWQTAVPVGVGVVAAMATGISLAWLVLRMTSTPMLLDWPGIGVFCGAAVVLVLIVTAATLPALRNATRLSALRTE
ncbi:MAG TPA: FtsX-like permease family protein, partial [Pseudonocardiaceae bacterium]|nr:FtsX-like permease family protein [Pseudonocardiaceae bacterium]